MMVVKGHHLESLWDCIVSRNMSDQNIQQAPLIGQEDDSDLTSQVMLIFMEAYKFILKYSNNNTTYKICILSSKILTVCTVDRIIMVFLYPAANFRHYPLRISLIFPFPALLLKQIYCHIISPLIFLYAYLEEKNSIC